MHDTLEAFAMQLIDLSNPEPDGSRRLVPERELCARLNVSRGALRERLSQLEYIGVLSRRQGHGTYLQAPGPDVIRTYFTTVRALGFLDSAAIAEAREMLETVVAVQAARRATPADAERLRQLVDEMVACTAADDHDAATEADLAFHAGLFRIVDNPVFTMVHSGLAHALQQAMHERRRRAIAAESPDAEGRTATDTIHYPIVDAIAANDPDAARDAIRRHFEIHSLITLDQAEEASA
ncbi:FadR/GntR family transcriptional regulator [Agrococcus sp. HG114]|uniref:FadR/GntR family transcriptional regulator n=1 Tax=Agrococcus sp. HG114 TaxID=2969757 RepID=UPI00215A45B7|nr:FCD domain-containing protein [Agrococcus sp. HG114]MCR8669619.1 FCD domain-containing protein [Agrococcus sp. HG114]